MLLFKKIKSYELGENKIVAIVKEINKFRSYNICLKYYTKSSHHLYHIKFTLKIQFNSSQYFDDLI
jgi:hypothetical protein